VVLDIGFNIGFKPFCTAPMIGLRQTDSFCAAQTEIHHYSAGW